MLESKIERAACKKVLAELGVANAKLVSPGSRGYPDRMFFIPGGKPLFVEFKRPGEKAEPLQSHIHNLLRQLGYSVEVLTDVESTVAAVKQALVAARLPKDSR